MSSSKMIGNLPAVLNFNWLFLKLKQFIPLDSPLGSFYRPILPDHRRGEESCTLMKGIGK
jgi:hypothetical protein